MKMLNIKSDVMTVLGRHYPSPVSRWTRSHTVTFANGRSYGACVFEADGFIYIDFLGITTFQCSPKAMKKYTDYYKSSWTVAFRNKRVS